MGDKKKIVKVIGHNREVNSSVLFNRIMCVIRNTSDMEDFFTYELAPQPPSLFHDGIMRKTQKSAFCNILKNYVAHLSSIPDNSVFVLDGGHLLHTVIWSTPSTIWRHLPVLHFIYTQELWRRVYCCV